MGRVKEYLYDVVIDITEKTGLQEDIVFDIIIKSNISLENLDKLRDMVSSEYSVNYLKSICKTLEDIHA